MGSGSSAKKYEKADVALLDGRGSHGTASAETSAPGSRGGSKQPSLAESDGEHEVSSRKRFLFERNASEDLLPQAADEDNVRKPSHAASEPPPAKDGPKSPRVHKHHHRSHSKRSSLDAPDATLLAAHSHPGTPSAHSRSSTKRSMQSIHESDGTPRMGSKNTVKAKEIDREFPHDEYDMTMYGDFIRLRPGELITLQDFKEKPSMNGLQGRCVVHDCRLHVATILLDDGRKIRGVPVSTQQALGTVNPDRKSAGKPVGGFMFYATEIVSVVLENEIVPQYRTVKEHVVVRPPSKERKPSKPQKEVEVVKVEQPVVKRKAKPRSKEPTKEETVEEAPKPTRPLAVGDQVIMESGIGARLGVGKVVEQDATDPNLLVVQFSTKGGNYKLHRDELLPWTRSRKSAIEMRQT